MSRVYFHSPSGTAELAGSERAWLHHVCQGPAEAAWDLDGMDALERAAEILALVPEVGDGAHGANYLHTYLREALEQEALNKEIYRAWKPGTPLGGNADHRFADRLVSSLKTAMKVHSLPFVVAGVKLYSSPVGLNTALVAGSDVLRLAAKIHGMCELHAWVEGPDREWLAGIIDDGLRAGIYRRRLRYSDTPDGPRDKTVDQGWESVQELLRARDDEPVVMSYSVGDSFPNPEVAGWEPRIDPDWRPDWATDGTGPAEWAEFDEATKADYRRDHARELWYELPSSQEWELAMTGLRERRPWARLAPDTLAEQMFHVPVTVYDLLAPDRDERVRAAASAVSV